MITLIKTALGAVKGSWVNIALVLAVVSALIGYITYEKETSYNAGFNAATLEAIGVSQKAVGEATRAFKAEAVQRLRVHEKELTEANRIVQELLERKPDVVYKEIKVAAEASECKRIGADSRMLINSLIKGERG